MQWKITISNRAYIFTTFLKSAIFEKTFGPSGFVSLLRMCIWCYLFFNSWTEIMLWDVFLPQMAGDVFCNHFSFHEVSPVGRSIMIFGYE